MKKTWIGAALALVVLLVAGLWLHGRADAKAVQYRTAAVARGDVQATVAATGKLGAVTTVQVGTQVSGQISDIFVDFNDHVKKGELLARIDPTLQKQAVVAAQADLMRNQAQLEQAQGTYDRDAELHDAKVITDTEFDAARFALASARAAVQGSQVNLDKARQNLAYTNIYSPIDGVVVERNVDVGQTVAASLSAPQLFLIANDLRHMQILASVDESDIGQIHEGQAVEFGVQPYPSLRFQGTVKQVRLQSQTTDNVVNYTAVVSVDNPDGKLLPGMTATVDFVTGSATGALTVPSAALRFRPPADVLAKLQGGAARAGSAGSTTRGTIWVLDADGALAPERVQVGISDGQKTVVTGRSLTEGATVVLGVLSDAAAASVQASPFQPQAGARGPRGGF